MSPLKQNDILLILTPVTGVNNNLEAYPIVSHSFKCLDKTFELNLYTF